MFVKHYASNHAQALNKKKKTSSKLHGICPKGNQVIYTLDTICMPNIKILAQAVLQIVCSQGPLGLLEKGNNSAKYSQQFMKFNPIIYIMLSNCMPDIMTLAQAVLQLFCSQCWFTIQYAKVGKGQ